MKITVFTSNQPRHIHLIENLAKISNEVYAILECNTVFPGQVEDFFKKSDTMREYFTNVINAENEIFGRPRFLPPNVKSLSLKMGDLSKIQIDLLKESLDSDIYIVFGSSYIKGDLIDILLSQRAVNIHMGISPYYRGSSCNFWALYDKKPDYVGATIHLLSKGLDSGPMLFHAIPKAQKIEPFKLGMEAVRAAHQGLIKAIESGDIFKMEAVEQDKAQEIRYTKNRDFTDNVALEYLQNQPTPEFVFESLNKRDNEKLIRPYIQ